MKDGDTVEWGFCVDENGEEAVRIDFDEDMLIQKLIGFLEAQLDAVFEPAKSHKAEISIMELGFALKILKHRLGIEDKWIKEKEKELGMEE